MKMNSNLDYSTFSKKELDQLYKAIIDAARKDSNYRRHLMQTWDIGIEEFWKRALECQFKDIKEGIRKEKYKNTVIKYLVERWATMSDEDADREWDHLKAEVTYKNPN
jgi:hypothetical protein